MISRLLDQPNWFGAVMGTGGFAAVVAMNPGDFAVLAAANRAIGVALLIVSAVFFLFLLVRGTATGLFGRLLRQRVASPVTGPHYATVPGAINVLAVVWLQLFPDAAAHPVLRWVVLTMAAVGTGLGLWLTVAFFVGTFERETFDAEDISGTWFIPETVILLGSLAFGLLAASTPPGTQRSLAVVSLALLGVGTVLFGFTATLYVDRLVLHRHTSRRSAPAMWIMLSPLSVASLAIELVASNTGLLGGTWGPAVQQTANFFAAILWGFSLWWFAVAAVLTAHVGRAALTRTPADWGYVFPLSAFSLSTMTLADAWESGLMEVLGAAASAFLTIVWFAVLAGAFATRRGPGRSRTGQA